MSYLFTSEAVSCGHPDKICDQLSDAVLDLHLKADSSAHTAIECLATTDRVIIAGETLSNGNISNEQIEDVIRGTIKNIGCNQPGFNWRTLKIQNLLHRQSENIASGIGSSGAGDQGIMFGYAKKEEGFDTQYMPLAAFLANGLLLHLRTKNPEGLLSDAKSQITLKYDDDGRAREVTKIVLSTQHEARLSPEDVREIIRPLILEYIPSRLFPEKAELIINPAGNFVIGGPDGDCGLTGRKIIVDTYGGYAPHGGGAFSGKDPSKVDRSAAYMMRYLAKNIVAAGLADECLLQISYAIGKADPLSLFIDCKNTEKCSQQQILDFLLKNTDLTPQGIIRHLNLRQPIYLPTAAYGHFGRTPDKAGHFSWEKTDLTEELKKCL